MYRNRINIIVGLILLALVLISCDNSDEVYSNGYAAGEQIGYSSGYGMGQSDGYDSGLVRGIEDGYIQGYDVGHDEGYDEGYEDGLDDGRVEGRELGYTEGYQVGYGDAKSEKYQNGDIPLRSLGDIVFSYQITSIMFLVFAIVNTVIVFVAGTYLVFSIKNIYVRIAKGLVVFVSSYIWFRVMQEIASSFDISEFQPSWVTATMLEIGIMIGAFLLFYLFDKLYLKNRYRRIWIDIIGLVFSTTVFLQFINYIINWRVIAISNDLLRPLYMIMSFSIGGILYVIYALLNRYIDDQENIPANDIMIPKDIEDRLFNANLEEE